MHVTIEDIIVEHDKVVVRNTWTGTDRTSGMHIRFSEIVIWTVKDGKLAERWAYLESPKSEFIPRIQSSIDSPGDLQ